MSKLKFLVVAALVLVGIIITWRFEVERRNSQEDQNPWLTPFPKTFVFSRIEVKSDIRLFIDGKKITDEGILKHFIEDFEEFNASNIEAYFAHETFKVFNDSNMEYASLFGFLKDTIYYSMDCDSIINISNTKEITNRSPNMVIAALNNEPGEPVEISNETNIYSSEIAYRYTNGELFIPKLGYKYATVGYEESGVIENHFNPQVVHELKNDTLAIIEYEVVFN